MKKYTFIDLFAGIGGFHIALNKLNAECVFASEIDKFARETYTLNHFKTSPKLFKLKNFNKDITKIDPVDIPDFDILCAGFPCQPFSQAGHKKGFDDYRGNLFFNIANIIEEKQPKAFILENVRNLLNHDDGNTMRIIKDIIENELNYSLYYKVIKASEHGLPQHRARIFLVGFKNDKLKGTDNEFKFPEATILKMTMSDIFEGECPKKIGFTLRVGGRGSGIKDRRNWDSYMVNGKEQKIGSKEAKKMQGISETFKFPVSETQTMKQLGNSVAIPVVEAIAKNVLAYMEKLRD